MAVQIEAREFRLSSMLDELKESNRQLEDAQRRLSSENVTLRDQRQRLRIEIDQSRKDEEVTQIVETDYFQSLQSRARESAGPPPVDHQATIDPHDAYRIHPLLPRRDWQVEHHRQHCEHACAAGDGVAIVDTDIQSPGIHVLFQVDPQRLRYTSTTISGRCRVEETAVDVSDAIAEDGGQQPSGAVLLVSVQHQDRRDRADPQARATTSACSMTASATSASGWRWTIY